MKKTILSIASIVALAASAVAQIPNVIFESFTTVGAYEAPIIWGTMDNTTVSIYTASKGTPAVWVGKKFIYQHLLKCKVV